MSGIIKIRGIILLFSVHCQIRNSLSLHTSYFISCQPNYQPIYMMKPFSSVSTRYVGNTLSECDWLQSMDNAHYLNYPSGKDHAKDYSTIFQKVSLLYNQNSEEVVLTRSSATFLKQVDVCICDQIPKRSLIHSSHFWTLRMCNTACASPTALQFGSRSILSLYLATYIRIWEKILHW